MESSQYYFGFDLSSDLVSAARLNKSPDYLHAAEGQISGGHSSYSLMTKHARNLHFLIPRQSPYNTYIHTYIHIYIYIYIYTHFFFLPLVDSYLVPWSPEHTALVVCCVRYRDINVPAWPLTLRVCPCGPSHACRQAEGLHTTHTEYTMKIHTCYTVTYHMLYTRRWCPCTSWMKLDNSLVTTATCCGGQSGDVTTPSTALIGGAVLHSSQSGPSFSVHVVRVVRLRATHFL